MRKFNHIREKKVITIPKHHRIIILGSGPGGCTAAIYTARANLESAVITGLEQGGQLTKTADIENWPGEDAGISGIILMEKMLKQAQHFGSKIISDSIAQTDLSKRPFYLKGSNDEYTCDALIIATGASAKYLGISSEQKYMGRGVSGCAVCDGFFYKNKKVAVIGGGNTAAEDAMYLAKLASEVTIIHRREGLRIESITIEQLKRTRNIKFELNQIVDEILGDEHGVTGIRIKNVASNLTKEIEISGVFIAIGHKPNTEIFANQLDMEHGYIKTGLAYGAETATSIPGVFAAGDVINQNYHQAVVAAGSGCMSAIDIKNFLSSL
ncbi:thioredoxin reductase [Gammaproteobacteria bacterium]